MQLRSPLLELAGVSKRYAGVQALDDVSIDVAAGEVLAIVGENGAGKSTLLKVLAGIVTPDRGEITLDGARRRIRAPRDAQALGIGLIHQELCLAPDLSAAENIGLGRFPARGPRWLGRFDRRRLHADAARALNLLNAEFAPTALVKQLRVADQQLVEIAKALAADARLLIFDEPTSSLAKPHADRLLALIGELKRRGIAVIYVSHRLDEVRAVADRVCVLRDGRRIDVLPIAEAPQDRLIRLMVGRELTQFFPAKGAPDRAAPPALEVRNLQAPGLASPVSFDLHRGEILGVAGIVGAGRTELAQALFGISRRDGGEVRVGGRPLGRSPHAATRSGVALAPEDRKGLGLFLAMPVRVNVTVSVLDRLARWPWYNRRADRQAAVELCRDLGVKTPSVETLVGRLSGGNQQKAVLARCLALRPRVLILDEPTRGVDVGAKRELYELIRRQTAAGAAALLISSELEEIVGLADRVLVMRRGRIVGELAGDQVQQEAIMALAVSEQSAEACA